MEGACRAARPLLLYLEKWHRKTDAMHEYVDGKRTRNLGQRTRILPLPFGTARTCPHAGHLRNAVVLRSFHMRFASRLARSTSSDDMEGPFERAAPVALKLSLSLATMAPRPGTLAAAVTNPWFSRLRASMFLDRARSRAMTTMASAIQDNGVQWASAPMSARTMPPNPMMVVSSSTP